MMEKWILRDCLYIENNKAQGTRSISVMFYEDFYRDLKPVCCWNAHRKCSALTLCTHSHSQRASDEIILMVELPGPPVNWTGRYI